MKRFIAVWLVLCIVCFTGCKGLGETIEDMRSSREDVEDFLFLLGNDIGAAKEYLHPNFYAEKGGFDAFVEDFESEHGVKFSNGVTLATRGGCSAEGGYYPKNDYKYSSVDLSYGLIIGVKYIAVYIQVREDEYGRGIYIFEEYED